jgi:hypothetical protein
MPFRTIKRQLDTGRLDREVVRTAVLNARARCRALGPDVIYEPRHVPAPRVAERYVEHRTPRLDEVPER